MPLRSYVPRMECTICGQAIVPGETRVPTERGTVHASCRGHGDTSEPTGEGYDPVTREYDLRRGLVAAAALAGLYLALRYLTRRARA